MIRRLTLANSKGDAAIVMEVSRLLEEIRSAWVAIGPEVRKSARLPAPVNATVGGRQASV
jgi:flagellin-specific chaperone FliS